VARVAYREEVIEAGELDLLPKDVRRKAIRKLRDNPEAGKPLVRELAGCRSLRAQGSENRIVYRYHPDEDLVEVIAIERRRDNEVYDEAAKRLASV
jgi:mRNA-degrading endonuclease RelE of RelBE toxin-antitoxin system